MHRSRILFCTGLIAVALNALAGEPTGELPQLMQLNRASQQELRGIQANPGSAPAPASRERPWRKKSLDREQQLQQGTLQESQRREVLMEQQRARTTNQPSPRRRLDAIGRQQRHRLQQNGQLNQFRARQQVRGR